MALSQDYQGRSTYLADALQGAHRLFITVACRVGSLPGRTYALLDTAGEWCVLTPAQATELGLEPGADLPPAVLSTRFGAIRGRIERLPVTLLAQEGEDLTLDATWFVSEDWPGPPVIGWKGCLERLRFALDPDDESFYFGSLRGSAG
jgi:hypothetical protein